MLLLLSIMLNALCNAVVAVLHPLAATGCDRHVAFICNKYDVAKRLVTKRSHCIPIHRIVRDIGWGYQYDAVYITVTKDAPSSLRHCRHQQESGANRRFPKLAHSELLSTLISADFL